jgi:hypothetical protein
MSEKAEQAMPRPDEDPTAPRPRDRRPPPSKGAAVRECQP